MTHDDDALWHFDIADPDDQRRVRDLADGLASVFAMWGEETPAVLRAWLVDSLYG